MTFTNYNSEFNASQAMKSYIITNDEALKKTNEYKKISKLIFKLVENGSTFVGKGYCISMSDIVYTILKQNNIPCKIVECHLTITNKTTDEIYNMGFDGLKDDPNKADTHVVVVTQTEHPMVIDVSIAHLLPNNLQGVIDSLVDDEYGIFADTKNDLVALTYQNKKTYSIPMLHQRSIIDRIKTDVDIFKSLNLLKIMIYFAITISFLNASRGFYDFYQVYINEENNWGPSGIAKVMDRVSINSERIGRIEDKLDNIRK